MTTTRRAGGAPSNPPAPPAPEPTEAAMVRTILLAARLTGWRIAHFRPAQTGHGWRTPVQGDGAGFPDLIMIHPGGHQVWWVELKSAAGRLDADQKAWRDALETAGERWLLVRGKAGQDELIDQMVNVHETAR